MSSSRHASSGAVDLAAAAYRRVLWAVMLINAAMFLVEVTGGFLGRSTALQADAVDFLGDAVTYGITLYVIGKSVKWRASAALLKGAAMGTLGVWVLANAAYHVMIGSVPNAWSMGGIGTLAFAANMVSALLLVRFRNGDSNIRSVWLCSRNDAIGNVAVVFAATGVFATGTGWPDVAVAVVMAAFALTACHHVLKQAIGELRVSRPAAAGAAD